MIDLAPAGGLLLDRLFGEPPVALHPVAWFGRAMHDVEWRLYADSHARGVLHCCVGVASAGLIGAGMERAIGRRAAVVIAVALASAGRMLEHEARVIDARLDASDLAGARDRLRSLAGRDATTLDAAGVWRAVIESVAENTTDAVVGTLWWAVAAGAPGALVHRAANTLDAMVGHRTPRHERFGWASARLDDVLNWGPARLTAAAVAIATPRRARAVWRAVRRDAPAHPSRNAGVVEAAFAAALDLQLGGENVYDGRREWRGQLGAGREPRAGDVDRAVRLARRATAVSIAILSLSKPVFRGGRFSSRGAAPLPDR